MTGSIAIVGAGPAGLSAAIAASEAGCHVTVLDEAERPGGQIFRQAAPELKAPSFATKAEQQRKHALLDAFASLGKQITYIPGAQVISGFPGPELQYVADDKTHTLRPDAVILATGVREKVFPFDGWTLPGVLGAGGAQSILKAQNVLPGKRIVIAGAGPLPMVVAAQMTRAGGDVLALAQLHPVLSMARDPLALLAGGASVREGLGYLATVLRARIPQLTGYVPIRAEGKHELEAVVLARTNPNGNIIAGSEKRLETDVLALNYGFVANSELTAMFGADMQFDEFSGWHPVTDDEGRTSDPRVFACGDGAGLRGSYVAQAEGFIVGTAAAVHVQQREVSPDLPGLAQMRRTRARHLRFQNALRETLKLPPGLWNISTPETIICRCEGVRKHELLTAFEYGHTSVNAAKRNTRCGMGWCNGRSCLHSVTALASQATKTPPEAPMTPRPVVRPVTLGALANAAEDGGQNG